MKHTTKSKVAMFAALVLLDATVVANAMNQLCCLFQAFA